MRGKWLILWFAFVLSALIIGGCGSTESTATSSTTGGAGETPAPVQPAQPTEAPVDAPDPVRARDVALAYVSGRYGEQAPALGLSWTDENVTPEGLVGASTFQFAAHAERGDADWAVTVSFPIVAPQATVYQVVVANQVTGFQWEGEVDAAGQVVERGDAETPDAMFEGISFSYDDALAAEVVSEIVPAEELRIGGVEPEHVRFSLNGYSLADTFHEPQVHVYAVSDLKANLEYGETLIANLQQSLAEKQVSPAGIRILPPENVGGLIFTQSAYVDFQNGTGVRFLNQVGFGGIVPINNYDLFYTFQGLTSDGAYYVAAILPVSHPTLPADSTEIPGDDPTAFAADFDTYRVEIEQQLGAQLPSSFTPDLSLLDALIQSLEVVPTFSAGVIEPPTEEAAQPSEIVSLDETWNQYTNDDFGFSFQYPADWALEIVPRKALEGGGIWADAVVLHKDKMAISIQYMHTSGAEGVGWGGVGGGGPYDQATVGNKVTLIGQEAQKWVWTYNGGIKAIQVQAVSRDANLALTITLCDDSVVLVEDPAPETIPETAIGVLDQILSSFALTQ